MAQVVFLRAANVSGSNVFKPAALAKDLAHLDVTSLGAAGTFVVRQPASAADVRAEFERRLPFQTDIIVRPAKELASLVASAPFGGVPARGAKPYVSVLATKPRKLPPTLVERPAGKAWMVRVLRVEGRYALSWQRRVGGRMLYPNEVVEAVLGVRATTRGWPTLVAIGRRLAEP
jgi:uncharacterized protein (DUF1697 family)